MSIRAGIRDSIKLIRSGELFSLMNSSVQSMKEHKRTYIALSGLFVGLNVAFLLLFHKCFPLVLQRYVSLFYQGASIIKMGGKFFLFTGEFLALDASSSKIAGVFYLWVLLSLFIMFFYTAYTAYIAASSQNEREAGDAGFLKVFFRGILSLLLCWASFLVLFALRVVFNGGTYSIRPENKVVMVCIAIAFFIVPFARFFLYLIAQTSDNSGYAAAKHVGARFFLGALPIFILLQGVQALFLAPFCYFFKIEFLVSLLFLPSILFGFSFFAWISVSPYGLTFLSYAWTFARTLIIGALFAPSLMFMIFGPLQYIIFHTIAALYKRQKHLYVYWEQDDSAVEK